MNSTTTGLSVLTSINSGTTTERCPNRAAAVRRLLFALFPQRVTWIHQQRHHHQPQRRGNITTRFRPKRPSEIWNIVVRELYRSGYSIRKKLLNEMVVNLVLTTALGNEKSGDVSDADNRWIVDELLYALQIILTNQHCPSSAEEEEKEESPPSSPISPPSSPISLPPIDHHSATSRRSPPLSLTIPISERHWLYVVHWLSEILTIMCAKFDIVIKPPYVPPKILSFLLVKFSDSPLDICVRWCILKWRFVTLRRQQRREQQISPQCINCARDVFFSLDGIYRRMWEHIREEDSVAQLVFASQFICLYREATDETVNVCAYHIGEGYESIVPSPFTVQFSLNVDNCNLRSQSPQQCVIDRRSMFGELSHVTNYIAEVLAWEDDEDNYDGRVHDLFIDDDLSYAQRLLSIVLSLCGEPSARLKLMYRQ